MIAPTGRDVHGEAARIRERGPVTPVELPHGVPAWAISSAPLLKRLLTDPRVSKDARRHWPRRLDGEVSSDWPLYTWAAVRKMFTVSGTGHKRLRTLVSKAFTARRTAAPDRGDHRGAARPGRHAGADDGAGGGAVDLREESCSPLPIQVIGEPSACPRSWDPSCASWWTASSTPWADAAEVTDIYARFHAVLGELVAVKRAAPGDDLTSALIAGPRGGAARHADADDQRRPRDDGRPALCERFPGLTLAVPSDELRPVDSFISHGHRSLPVLTG
ncbi:hypothetical protein [Streptomyces sp. DG1A-41]|uniref:hypothetical protein n=1 Tax=Streptomyces sp. DG1A-41 TaxID=3125779 RepID=UPI0030CDF278